MWYQKTHPVLYAADLETITKKNTKKQKTTKEWSSAIVKFETEDVHVFGTIQETLDWVVRKISPLYSRPHAKLFYHNLKFDGSFYLDWLLKHGFKHGFADIDNMKFKDMFDLSFNEFSCVISERGQWYKICFVYKGVLFEIVDSLKLLPFDLRTLGKAFDTKHKKLEMDYTNCTITKENLPYIKNDVLCLKECLEFMHSKQQSKLTIASCAMTNFKSIIGKSLFNLWFPNLSNIKLDDSYFDYIKAYGITDPEVIEKLKNADSYIRKSYRGGWCFVNPNNMGEQENGCTVDANSLYPSVMLFYMGQPTKFPVGYPTFWKGNIPTVALDPSKYYFVRIRCRFKLKDKHFPWIQIKGSPFYSPTECLVDSRRNYYSKELKKWYKHEWDSDEEKSEKVTLTLTWLDYDLLHQQYDVYDEEVLDGCYFDSATNIFDEYIEYWAEIKKTSKGAMRTLAKLMLNSIYGRFGQSPDDSQKVPFLKDNGVVEFKNVYSKEKETIFVAIASAISSYAKNVTIRLAQKNYDSVCYSDTDSLHVNCSPDELIDVPIHPTEFCYWKVESCWDKAYFVRQKTYIEHIVMEDGEPVEPYYDVKCAGLPSKCKDLFVKSMDTSIEITESDFNKLSKSEQKFLFSFPSVSDDVLNDEDTELKFEDGERIERTMEDFKVGLVVPGKLLPRRVEGGIVLTETEFTLH